MVDIPEQSFEEMEVNYLEYRTSRRTIHYYSPSLREIAADTTFLDFGKGNFMNLGVVIQVLYEKDERI
jgi:hypothetical protein